jgi:hypothetical protein
MRILIVAGIAALAIVGVACNEDGGRSSGSLSLQEYFSELDRIGDDADAASDAIELPNLDPDASFEESSAAFLDYFEQVTNIIEDGVQDISALDAPDEVSDEHDRYVDGLNEIMDASNDYLDRRGDADEDEFDEILSGDDPFEAIDAEITDACADLQAIADDNGIEIDLECDEDD